MVDIKDDQEIWTKRWYLSRDNIFQVQDEVSQEIALLIFPTLRGKGHERIKTKSPASFSSWDNHLQALKIFNRDVEFDLIMRHMNISLSSAMRLWKWIHYCVTPMSYKRESNYDKMFASEDQDERKNN